MGRLCLGRAPPQQCPGHSHPSVGTQADCHCHGAALRCFRSPAEPCLSCSKWQYLCSCAPVSQWSRAGGSGAALWSPRDAPRESLPDSPVEHSTNEHFPFSSGSGAPTAGLGCAALLAWAGQRFLICSAHPAGKTHCAVPAGRAGVSPPGKVWCEAGIPPPRSLSTVGPAVQ